MAKQIKEETAKFSSLAKSANITIE